MIGLTLCIIEAVLVVAWGYCVVRAMKSDDPAGTWFVAYNVLAIFVCAAGFAATAALSSGQ